jgi:hypothetical protein
MLSVWFPLSVRNVEDLLHERGIEISHETVRFWWNFALHTTRSTYMDKLRSYGAAMKVIGNPDQQETGRFRRQISPCILGPKQCEKLARHEKRQYNWRN